MSASVTAVLAVDILAEITAAASSFSSSSSLFIFLKFYLNWKTA